MQTERSVLGNTAVHTGGSHRLILSHHTITLLLRDKVDWIPRHRNVVSIWTDGCGGGDTKSTPMTSQIQCGIIDDGGARDNYLIAS